MIKKKIIILDDEPLISTLIKELIEEEGQDLEISKITTEKKEFLNEVMLESFDVALVDISVGGREGGLDILKTLKNKKIPVASIVLSAHDEDTYAIKALRAGARGYINKYYICTDLIPAIRDVCAGNFFVSGNRGKNILKEYASVSNK